MNAPDAPIAIDWAAVAAGAAASLAIGFSASLLMRPLYADGSMGYALIATVSFVVAMLADGIGGAVAGFMAKRRGALHGALAMVGASAFGVLASVVMMSRRGGDMQAFLSLQYWLQWLFYALFGIGVGTLAGLVAAKIAAKQSP